MDALQEFQQKSEKASKLREDQAARDELEADSTLTMLLVTLQKQQAQIDEFMARTQGDIEQMHSKVANQAELCQNM